MYVILLGAPGAGKGTQAAALSKTLGLAHVATGDLFRQAQQKGTPLGLRAKAYMEKGELVPDELTIQMLLERLEAPDCSNHAILDGFPRNVAQAKALDKALWSQGKQIDSVLYVKVSEDELIRRLSGRWICRKCQTPYHVSSSPPKISGRCDKCGGELYQRQDDKEETAKIRLKVYMDQTEPLIDYYVNDGKLIEIDGEQTIQRVGEDLKRALKGYAAKS